MKALIASAAALGLIAAPVAATTTSKPATTQSNAGGNHKAHKNAKKTNAKKNDAFPTKKTS